MGYGPSVQEALDPLRKSGVHVRRRSGVDIYEGVWRDNELARRRSGAGLYVLAFLEASFWLVPRTGLRLQLRARAPALDWDKRRPADRDPTKTLNLPRCEVRKIT